MKPRLFLTGPMGCGKSTVIARALGERISSCGGFLTRRILGTDGHARSFVLGSPDGLENEIFLDFSSGKPDIRLNVFSNLGKHLLSREKEYAVLDEIGGIELLSGEFTAALDVFLKSGIPCIGVLKGESPAGALIEALGLTAEYQEAADRLRRRLAEDENTLVYSCGQFDEKALEFAQAWVKEYTHE